MAVGSVDIKIIVGLGNPGPKYQYTRHNVGFLALEELAGPKVGFKTKDQGEFTSLELGNTAVLLLKPQSFMNRSGEVVKTYLQYKNLPASQMLVIHDEADLAHGDLRLKKGGGAGGHNGLISIIQNLQAQDFYRLRVGVGKPEQQDLADYLLEKANKSMLLDLASRAAQVVNTVFKKGFVQAQNEINQRP